MFEMRLRDEDVPHWFAVTPAVIPNPHTGHPMISMMVALWRQSVVVGESLSLYMPVDDLLGLTDYAVIDDICTKLVGLLRERYLNMLAQQ